MTVHPLVINLASRRFRPERRENSLLASACVVLSVLFLVFATLLFQTTREAQRTEASAAKQEYRLSTLQREAQHYSALLHRPDSTDVYAWSTFFNQIIARRSISWVKLFEDLSTVMPPNMHLIGIRLPQVAPDDLKRNRVELDMVVGCDQPAVVLELLNALQKADHFGSASVVSEVAPSQEDPGTKFRVVVTYDQAL